MNAVALLYSLVAIATLNSHFRLKIIKMLSWKAPISFYFDENSIVLGPLDSIFHVESETIWTQ